MNFLRPGRSSGVEDEQQSQEEIDIDSAKRVLTSMEPLSTPATGKAILILFEDESRPLTRRPAEQRSQDK